MLGGSGRIQWHLLGNPVAAEDYGSCPSPRWIIWTSYFHFREKFETLPSCHREEEFQYSFIGNSVNSVVWNIKTILTISCSLLRIIENGKGRKWVGSKYRFLSERLQGYSTWWQQWDSISHQSTSYIRAHHCSCQHYLNCQQPSAPS